MKPFTKTQGPFPFIYIHEVTCKMNGYLCTAMHKCLSAILSRFPFESTWTRLHEMGQESDAGAKWAYTTIGHKAPSDSIKLVLPQPSDYPVFCCWQAMQASRLLPHPA